MADLILHHYPTSPFSEKIRAIFGYKKLAWKSVIIPTIMPKPDLLALTGGYRKTPVLQIGSDIYCDTKLMVRVIEQLHPEPALAPRGREASCAMHELWSEQLFLLCVPVAFVPAGMPHFFGKLPPAAIAEFQKDRAGLFSGGSARRASGATSKNELPGYLAQLETQLGLAPFIDGAAPTLADFSLYHPIWFVISNPGVSAYFDRYPNIRAWAKRIEAYGHGKMDPMTGEAAIQAARNSNSREGASGSSTAEFRIGESVSVAATDYGTDAVSGMLVKIDPYEVAIARSDARAGDVVVHFPRAGFSVTAAASNA